MATETPSSQAPLGQEWLCLQQQYDRHEQRALWIKLIALILTVVLLAYNKSALLTMLAVLLFWGQEAILRTVQQRLATRLLQLETAIAGASDSQAFQLHREWLRNRGGVLQLVVEYARQACKPTVLYPYALLVLLVVWSWARYRF